MGCCCSSSSEHDNTYSEPMLSGDDDMLQHSVDTSLTKDDFHTKSHILKRGFCTKQGSIRKNWTKRFFILSSGVLSYYEKCLDVYPYSSGYKGHISLTYATISSSVDSKTGLLTIDITNEAEDGKSALLFRGDDDEDTKEWAAAIDEQIYAQAKSPSPVQQDTKGRDQKIRDITGATETNDPERPHTVSDHSASDSIIISGWLSKKGSVVKTWKTRYFILSQGWMSYYAKGPPHVADRKGQMPLDGANVTLQDNLQLLVKSTILKRELWLRYESEELRERWRNVIEDEIGLIGSVRNFN